MSMLRTLYNRALSNETRYWLYKLRHKGHFEQLRTRTNHHKKGDFSLRDFTEKEAIFVHITKSAGTSVALSLFGALPYHYTAWHYRVIFGRRDFDRYFKFSFVRNPWDRLYSAYNYLKNGGWDDKDKAWAEKHWAGIGSFEQFVVEWLTRERLYSHLHLLPQSYFLFDAKGNILIDYLGYFETINDDFQIIANRVNPGAELSHTNASERGSYKKAYSDKTKRKVAELYQEDIQNFGYGFSSLKRKRIVDKKLIPDE